MISKDLKSYAASSWSSFIDDITTISKDSRKGISLIEDETEIYNFDKICFSVFGENIPTSVDGIMLTDNAIEFVEFKSGFKHKIQKDNLDPEKKLCKVIGNKYCTWYWDLFFKNRDMEIKELISSIRFKGLESYLTLEKKVLPHCDELQGKPLLLKYIVVIDGDGVEGIEDSLAEVAGKEESTANSCSQIKDALKRITRQTDAEGNTYCYDEVEVMSAFDFKNKLSLHKDN